MQELTLFIYRRRHAGCSRRASDGRIACRGQTPPSRPSRPKPWPNCVRVLEAGRQGYLDALPIAAAIVALERRRPFVECANEHFRFLAEWDERLGEQPHRPGADPARRARSARVSRAFLKADDPAHQFDTADGRSIGGRHFTVRFARLKRPARPAAPLPDLADRQDRAGRDREEPALARCCATA